MKLCTIIAVVARVQTLCYLHYVSRTKIGQSIMMVMCHCRWYIWRNKLDKYLWRLFSKHSVNIIHHCRDKQFSISHNNLIKKWFNIYKTRIDQKQNKKLTIAIALISLFHLLWILSNRFPQNVNFDRRKEAPAWLASQDRLDAIILSGNYLYAVAPPSRHFSGRESEESGKMGLMHSRKKGDDNRYLQRGIESSYFFFFFT